MKELIVQDDRDLRRLNLAIAALGARPDKERLRMHHLLKALVTARDEIERPGRRRTSHRYEQA